MPIYHVYWWHAPYHDFIKVGFGYAPVQRMSLYAEKYGVKADPSSLRQQEMRSRRAAKYAEAMLHQRLYEYGLDSFPWDAKSGAGEAQEFFDLGPNDYTSVDWLVRELLREIIRTMPTDAQLVEEEMARIRASLADFERREEQRLAKVHEDPDVPF